MARQWWTSQTSTRLQSVSALGKRREHDHHRDQSRQREIVAGDMLDPIGRHPPPGQPIPFKGVVLPRIEITTQVLAAIALIGALQLGLLASLLAGLLVYELVHVLAPSRNGELVARRTGKIIV